MVVTVKDLTRSPVVELFSLEGRVAVVTGGGRGLGRAIAGRLAEAGAAVVVADLDGTAAAAVAEEISSRHGTKAVPSAVDVRDPSSVEALADKAVESFGAVDIWVNNAGIFPIVPVMETPPALLDDVLDINAAGVLHGARAAAARIRRQGRGGAIVNIVSVAGFAARSPGVAAYVASKHAVRGLTRQLAIELAPDDIRVVGVAPAFVRTEGTLAGLPPEVSDRITSRLGRPGVPDDIARVVLFCASDAAAFITGSTLLVDAGELA